jgi:hypothetical protein
VLLVLAATIAALLMTTRSTVAAVEGAEKSAANGSWNVSSSLQPLRVFGGGRTFVLNRGGRSDRWRHSYSGAALVAMIVLLLLRGPAERLLTANRHGLYADQLERMLETFSPETPISS